MKNAVIVYMSRERDVGLLYNSLYLLFKNFNSTHKYPIIVFHDDIQQTTVSKILMGLYHELGFIPHIRWEFLKFQFPEHVSQDQSKYDPPLSRFPVGYRHMCRFHSGEIYKHPALLQYDWYWRLDSDSFLLSKIDYDVFERMEEKGYEYAYLREYEKEASFVAVNLWDTTKKFMADNNIVPASMNNKLKDGEWDWDIFYTNFEIAKFSFFRSENYMKYYDLLDSTGMIYYNRWGDAPIHWFGVHMFLPDEKIWCVKDITYQHGTWVKNTEHVDMASVARCPEPFKTWATNAIDSNRKYDR